MDKEALITKFLEIRKTTEDICKPLEIEDYIPQPHPDVSPPRWHLAHTTWFFETFMLKVFAKNYNLFHPLYAYLFNSYYRSSGRFWERSKRGNLSRPSVKEIYAYRKYIDDNMSALILEIPQERQKEFSEVLILGLNHEQQHQELLVCDLKYILMQNPLRPVYIREEQSSQSINTKQEKQSFKEFEAGDFIQGHEESSFAFDNELPAHKTYLYPFRFSTHPVTNQHYEQFINEGGYKTFQYWLDDGWNLLKTKGWEAPLYWEKIDSQWHELTLLGPKKLNLQAPVTHISYYEAAAFAKWAGKRLPTEGEWEYVVKQERPSLMEGNFLENRLFHPQAGGENSEEVVLQLMGDVWEWTNSAYLPYPGYKQANGALGEYNGKFMINQMTLRGGSCASPRTHLRYSYRNFFQAEKRWIFSGIRLAETI